MHSHKKQVQDSYNKYAKLYQSKARMQSGNLKNLLCYLDHTGINLTKGKYLDVGCGTGILSKVLNGENRAGDIDYYGIDFSKSMLDVASQNSAKSSHFIVSDVEHLPFKEETFDGAFSNSVLHWLNEPGNNKTPKKAIENIYNVLMPGGFLATSISGHGTARRFQRAYKETIDEIRDHDYFQAERHRDDPIGSMNLADTVELFQKAGFIILKALIAYEPVTYPRSIDYVTDVKAYGYEVYLASIKEEYNEEVWEKIKNRFVKQEPVSPYTHDQYMIYIVAEKPSIKSE